MNRVNEAHEGEKGYKYWSETFYRKIIRFLDLVMAVAICSLMYTL